MNPKAIIPVATIFLAFSLRLVSQHNMLITYPKLVAFIEDFGGIKFP